MKTKGLGRRIEDGSICGCLIDMMTDVQKTELKGYDIQENALKAFLNKVKWEGGYHLGDGTGANFSMNIKKGEIEVTPWAGNTIPEKYRIALSKKETELLIEIIKSCEEFQEKDSSLTGFECPCCGRYRIGETGEEFEGKKICVSCLEGMIED